MEKNDTPDWAQEPIQAEHIDEDGNDEEAPAAGVPPPAWMSDSTPIVMDEAQVPASGPDGPSHAQPGIFVHQ